MAGNFNLNFLGGGPGISAGLSLGGLGFSVNLTTQSLPIAGQTFRTIPLPNFNPALYGLAIRGGFGSLIGGFTFPLSPTSLRKEYAALSNIYDVQGTAQQGGVNRVLDAYGISPVTFIIEGTTGWQFHSTDGYLQTGLQAIATLEQFFFQYAEINAANAQNNQTLYTMEFYDYFRGDFWQVEPVGPQGVHIANNRPLLVNYAFRLAGIQNLANPSPAENDQVANVLSGAQQPTPGTGGSVIDQPQSAGGAASPSSSSSSSGVTIEDISTNQFQSGPLVPTANASAATTAVVDSGINTGNVYDSVTATPSEIFSP